MEFLLNATHELVKFAGLLLMAQGLVFVFSFGRHEANPVYRFVRFLTSPVTRVVRQITPRFVLDKHVPVAAFFLLFWLYLFLIYLRLPYVSAVAN